MAGKLMFDTLHVWHFIKDLENLKKGKRNMRMPQIVWGL